MAAITLAPGFSGPPPIMGLLSPHLVIHNRADMMAPPPNRLSAPEARKLSDTQITHMQWALLTKKDPALVGRYLSQPLNNRLLYEIAQKTGHIAPKTLPESILAKDQIIAQHVLAANQPVDLKTIDEPAVRALFAGMQEVTNTTIRIVLDPKSGLLKLEFHNPQEDTLVNQDLFHGAWKFSSLIRGYGAQSIKEALSDPALLRQAEEGARILILPEHTKLTQPQIVRMQLSSSTPQKAEFWFPRRGQTRRQGSAVSLLLPNITERFDVDTLIDKIIDDAKITAAKGKQPALALDVDGTLIDLREYVIELFREWANTLEDADRRRVIDIARTKNEQEMRAWDLPTLIQDNLGITDEHIIASASAFHKQEFYNADRRVNAPTVPGMIQLIKTLQTRAKKEGIDLATVFVTLRSDKDDTMADGKSSVEVTMTRLGIWNEHSSLTRHTGEQIDWDVAAFTKSGGGSHEPPKWEKVKAYRDAHPNIWFISVFDNAPAHLNGYEKYFGHNVIKVHIEGDLPPGSPPVNEGAFVINPFQLVSALELLGHY